MGYFDTCSGDVLFCKNENERREIASLTKIMTAYVSLRLVEANQIDPFLTHIKVSTAASSVIGTSASLQEGHVLTILDLLHGLLLPSGNDAAINLAEYFGEILLMKENSEDTSGSFIKYFVKEMNRYAKLFGMTNTQYSNPHGLANKNSWSTAADVGKLCAEAMKIPLLKQIVGTRNYTCSSVHSQTENLIEDKENMCNDSNGSSRDLKTQKNSIKSLYRWTNTNKLLERGYYGLKTGVTPTAGPCLAASYKKDTLDLTIIVLNSKTMDHRWYEVRKLTQFCMSRLNKLNQFLESKENREESRTRLMKSLRYV